MGWSPNAHWMREAARQLMDAVDGFALGKAHLIIDRDTKYCDAFRDTLQSAGVKIVLCPPRAPQCNAFAERFVRSVKEECLNRLDFLSEAHLRTTLSSSIGCYRQQRNPQGIENQFIEPPEFLPKSGRIRCQKQLGGMLNCYYREAA
jgi:putative transposase